MIIKNVNIEIQHPNSINSGAWYGDKVELYGERFTIIIKTKSTRTAKQIFKKHNLEWTYWERAAQCPA